MSAEQRTLERRLLERYAASGDRRTRDEIITRFMPLARSLAQRYRSSSEPLEDLVQVANLALVKAVEGFDPARGKPFTAYAVPTILGELRRHFRDRVPRLHLPRGLQERTMAVDTAVTELSREHGRPPTVRAIAAALEISEEDVLEAMQAADARRTHSLDAPVSRDDGESTPTVETIGGRDPSYDRVEAELACDSAGLDPRERRVLELRFNKGLTQTEIGERLGVSQMQISRISRRALRKLLAAVRGEPSRPAAARTATSRERRP